MGVGGKIRRRKPGISRRWIADVAMGKYVGCVDFGPVVGGVV